MTISSRSNDDDYSSQNGQSSKKIDEENDADEDVVRKFVFENATYLRSSKTNVVYDYKKYVEEGDAVVVGLWVESEKKIEFTEEDEEEDEEEEEEYEEDEVDSE
jgi:hypothetical protein